MRPAATRRRAVLAVLAVAACAALALAGRGAPSDHMPPEMRVRAPAALL